MSEFEDIFQPCTHEELKERGWVFHQADWNKFIILPLPFPPVSVADMEIREMRANIAEKMMIPVCLFEQTA